MQTYQAGLVGFIISVVGFYLISIFWGGKPTNIKEFFHDGNVRWNVFSLTAANLALGTGVVYVLDGTQAFGVLYLTLPLMLLFGQRVYAKLVSSVAPQSLFTRGTLLAGLADELDKANAGKKVCFQQLTIFYVIVTYILGLCYEIFVSAHWLATTMSPTPGVAGEAIIAFLVLALTLSYTVSGGYRTIQKTDVMQVFCAFILIGGLVLFLLFSQPSPNPSVVKAAWIPASAPLWIALLTMILTPFTAQFYGILNHSLASHQQESADRKKLFKRASILISAVYVILASAAFYYNHSKGDAHAAVESWLSSSMQAGGASAFVVVALAAIGMGAIVMSTVDTMMITITQTGYEGFFKGDSNQTGKAGLGMIRSAMLVIFIVAFSILLFLWKTKPDTLSLLFAAASPCEALAPLIVCLIYLAKWNKLNAILAPVVGKIRYIDLFFYVLLPLTLIAAFIALGSHWKWTRGIGFFAFAISAGLSLFIALRAKNKSA